MAKFDKRNIEAWRKEVAAAKDDVKEINDLSFILQKSISEAGKAQTKQNKNLGEALEITVKAAKKGKLNLKQLKDRSNLIGKIANQEFTLESAKREQRKLDDEILTIQRRYTGVNKEKGKQLIREVQKNKQLLSTEEGKLRTQELSKQALAQADKFTGGLASKAKSSFGFFKKMGPAATAGAVGIGLIGAAIGLAIKALKFASEITDALGKEFGVAGTQSGVFKDNMQDAAVEVISLGKGTADVVTLVDTLSKDFGIALDTASELPNQILDSAVAMGLTTDEGAKLFGTLMSIADLSVDQAEALAESTYQLATQNNVNPSAVMEDIAGSAEMIAKFGAENVESLTEAAVRARQLGLSLKTVEKIADSLLSFQSSLTAEIEASAFVGKRLNFQKARELALTGKTAEMMEEVISQLGDESDLILDNVLARKSLAASVGIEVAEMERLLKAQDKSFVAARSFSNIAGSDAMSTLTSIMNEIKEIGATFLKEFGQPLEDALKQFKDNFFTPERIESIKSFLTDFAGKLETILNLAVSVAGAFGFVGNMFSGAGGLGAIIGGAIGAVGGPAGIALGATIGSALLGNMVNDFKSSGGSHLVVTPMGRVLQTNPNDTVFGTTKVNDFASFPEGGLSINDGGNNAELLNTVNRLIEKVEAQTNVIKRTPVQIADGVRGRV